MPSPGAQCRTRGPWAEHWGTAVVRKNHEEPGKQKSGSPGRELQGPGRWALNGEFELDGLQTGRSARVPEDGEQGAQKQTGN